MGLREQPVGEARCVAHQLAHGHRMIGVLNHGHAVGPILLRDLEIRELGNELRHRVVEREATLVVVGHQRDTDDRLRHRVDAEDRVLRDRDPVLDVLLAVGVEEDDLALARDHRDDAGEFAVVDHAVHRLGELLEAGRVHADIGRLGLLEVTLAGKYRRKNEGRKQQAGGKGKRGELSPRTQSDHAWFLLLAFSWAAASVALTHPVHPRRLEVRGGSHHQAVDRRTDLPEAVHPSAPQSPEPDPVEAPEASCSIASCSSSRAPRRMPPSA